MTEVGHALNIHAQAENFFFLLSLFVCFQVAEAVHVCKTHTLCIKST